MKNILVIKLGALGDFFMALPAFNAIRRHHHEDRITLLTVGWLVELGERCGLFDRVMVDPRSRSVSGYLRMRRRLGRERFEFVYDLQGNRRTSRYFRLLWPNRPLWTGPERACSHPRPPRPPGAHRVEWYRAQLAALGITRHFEADPSWLDGDAGDLALPARYALIAAGSSPLRPEKRWPAGAYAALAGHLAAQGITPVLIGTAAEREVNERITASEPHVLNLTGRTDLFTLGALARRAVCAIGNDTGPMHLIAAVGCPTMALFSGASDPAFIGPRGARTRFLQRADLADLPVDEVIAAVKALSQGLEA